MYSTLLLFRLVLDNDFAEQRANTYGRGRYALCRVTVTLNHITWPHAPFRVVRVLSSRLGVLSGCGHSGDLSPVRNRHCHIRAVFHSYEQLPVGSDVAQLSTEVGWGILVQLCPPTARLLNPKWHKVKHKTESIQSACSAVSLTSSENPRGMHPSLFAHINPPLLRSAR